MTQLVLYTKIILRGVSQVMLQNNSLVGLLFLIGIFYNSWVMGLGALLGAGVGTFTAYILKYDKEDIYSGLYGFNGILVGIALMYFFEVNYFLILAIVAGAAVSSYIMSQMIRRKIPPYTFPFVASTWIVLAAIKYTHLASLRVPIIGSASALDIASSLIGGFGQVMFQASIVTGVIFFMGLMLSSRKSALFGLMGSIVGMLVAVGISAPLALINAGMFGFNGVLCGIACADKQKYSHIFALVSIALSVFIMYGMIQLNIITLTFPFVFSTWIIILFRYILQKRFRVLETTNH